jgi:3-oxoacyl-[acyl-carrier protein] reductase
LPASPLKLEEAVALEEALESPTMFDLQGKVAIVTGGSRGIGRACAKALAARGAHVVITYVGGEQAASDTCAEIVAQGGKAEAERFDVGNMAEAEQAISEVARRLGRLDILVANAGISLDGLLLRLKEEDLDRTLAVNLKGAIACCKAAIKPMIKSRAGRIIFVSSVVGESGNAGQTAYAASKGGMLGAAKSMAREYASRNITVNAVTPGYIQTDMTGALNQEQQTAMLSGVPLGRAGSAEEVAAAVVFLASDEAAYITGHTLRVNGGMLM